MSLGTMKSDEFTCIVISGDWPVVVVIMFGGNPSIIQSIETYRNMHESVMSQWNKYNTHLHSKASFHARPKHLVVLGLNLMVP